jgi:hypothetical protein
MLRQDFTLTLLDDLTKRPRRVSCCRCTPQEKRDESQANPDKYPFEVILNGKKKQRKARASRSH